MTTGRINQVTTTIERRRFRSRRSLSPSAEHDSSRVSQLPQLTTNSVAHGNDTTDDRKTAVDIAAATVSSFRHSNTRFEVEFNKTVRQV